MYGKRLRDLRKSRKLTLVKVAEKLNIAMTTYGAYEREEKRPSIDMLRSLANLYNVSTDYILGLTDEKDPKPNQDLLDVQKLFLREKLHWNGRPLNEEELEPIRKFLEIVVRDRLPKNSSKENKD
ncbi:helix-turn-helix transcriptional regulator [Fictibacillus sp. 5RED26]|uniref:helix-turn-helix domain-containing protein n=1 Tax=Fictibacillus sp. 5RED26 TaxID=2745876 RepID=UPI0018CED865|nr:helix-turn-helix transcriptional regulator [Fictibacillus sp. 5RED26]MBH0158742.1 helix-turn-helix transcriptional regulator [Fictibacillus sp. 5RED26]